MSVEIKNLVHAMGQFTGAAVPVLGRADGISAVTRPGAGRFKLVLEEKVTATQVNVHVSIGSIASPGIAVPYSIVDADGDIEVITRNATVNADPDAEIRVTVLRYPTIG